jgi:BirA family transcriptional regulator, biotin operon repressor / biotin---[acetyl-CoA-carboxylase] ligase
MPAPTPLEFDLSRLRGTLRDWELNFFPELESTNDWAIEAYRVQLPPQPCLIVAQKQTRGRGRGSHTWQAPLGNLTCSFAFPLACSPIEFSQLGWPARLAMASSLAVAETIDAFLPTGRCEIKWPNDLLIGGRKTAGILIETPLTASAAAESTARLVVIGIGLNVNSAPPAAALGQQRPLALAPTSLAEERDTNVDLTSVLLELADNLARWLATTSVMTLRPDQPYSNLIPANELRQCYQQALAWRGKRVVLQRGPSELIGVLQGVDESGQLLIRPSGEDPIPVASGELRLAE